METSVTILSPFTVTCILIPLALLLFYKRKKPGKEYLQSLPPGPFQLPIIGNLHQILSRPQKAMADLADKYGPIMLLRTGKIPTVIVSTSEAAKHFLKVHDRVCADRPHNPILGGALLNSDGVVLAPYGDRWRLVRKTCFVQFFSAKKVEAFAQMREERVLAMIHSLLEESDHGKVAVNLSDALSRLSADLSLEMVAGTSYTAELSRELQKCLHEIECRFDIYGAEDCVPLLGFLNLGTNKRRIERSMRKINSVFDKVIAEHEELKVGKRAEIEDIVDVLIDMKNNDEIGGRNNEQIKSLLLDLYIAGADTTSTSLTWTMTELIRHPEVIERLKREIQSFIGDQGEIDEDSLRGLRYLDSVVKESLRLHPPIALGVPHEPVEALNVMGFHIEEKMRINFNLWAIGRDPKVWDEANEFRPERFMKDEEIDMTGMNDFKMIPFGAGRRACPGFVLALPLLKLAIAHLVWDLDWVVEGGHSSVDMEEKMGFTFRKKSPLYLIPKLSVAHV